MSVFTGSSIMSLKLKLMRPCYMWWWGGLTDKDTNCSHGNLCYFWPGATSAMTDLHSHVCSKEVNKCCLDFFRVLPAGVRGYE